MPHKIPCKYLMVISCLGPLDPQAPVSSEVLWSRPFPPMRDLRLSNGHQPSSFEVDEKTLGTTIATLYIYNPSLQKNTRNDKYVGLTFSVGVTIPSYGLQLVLSKTIKIGDTKYHI